MPRTRRNPRSRKVTLDIDFFYTSGRALSFQKKSLQQKLEEAKKAPDLQTADGHRASEIIMHLTEVDKHLNTCATIIAEYESEKKR